MLEKVLPCDPFVINLLILLILAASLAACLLPNREVPMILLVGWKLQPKLFNHPLRT